MFLEICISIYKHYIFFDWFSPMFSVSVIISVEFDLAKYHVLN